ncbi:hypothetical protein IFR05_008816 [Cadophora sp. M221]|nr:hypothetical protein IFR05_008816 [Cadophora sp. M221]
MNIFSDTSFHTLRSGPSVARFVTFPSVANVALKHRATHGKTVKLLQAPTALPEQETQVACANCAKAKTKCDRQSPCGRCRSKGITCILRVPQRPARGHYQEFAEPEVLNENSFGLDTSHGESSEILGQSMVRTSVQGIPGREADLGSFPYTHQNDDFGRGDLSPPPVDVINPFENSHHLFSPMDWDWERIFGSQPPSPHGQPYFPIDVETPTPSNAGSACNEATPPRSVENVARLGDNFVDTAPWSEALPTWREQHFSEEERFNNVSITETTRDRILGNAQTFFRLALDRLNINSNPGSRFLVGDMKKHSSSTVLLLPPTPILSIYLETFLTSFEPLYPLLPRRLLDPNIVDAEMNEQLAVILLLLMVSHGAMRDSAIKARRLSMGLLEISRLVLFNLLDQDNSTPRMRITGHCALMCMYQSAFSGDKWLMNSCLGQTQMYLAVAKQSRVFERDSCLQFVVALEPDGDETWKKWLNRESDSRLAYSWVMLDQEISLVYDQSPALAIPELERCLPDSDDLWLATDALEWRKSWQRMYGSAAKRPSYQKSQQHSLSQLFKLFLENKIDTWDGSVSILHVRLLLYPLHVLIEQESELSMCFSDRSLDQTSRSVCYISVNLRLNEVRSLLRTWWEIFDQLEPRNMRQRALKQSTLLLFHLLNLKLSVSFPYLEQYSRKVSTQPEDLQRLLEIGIHAAQEAILQCGQVLRVIRETEIELRPLWWPSAIYRVAIIMLALGNSATTRNLQSSDLMTMDETPSNVAVDTVSPSDRGYQSFLKRDRGTPCFTTEDGNLVPIEDVSGILHICINILLLHQSKSGFAEGLVLSLESLL